MNSQSEFVSAAARKLIDQHLDAVEHNLAAAGTDRSDRRAVCDELETQITEMLRSRHAEPATNGEIAAVLQELDAPESYSSDVNRRSWVCMQSEAVSAEEIPKISFVAFIAPFACILYLFSPWQPLRHFYSCLGLLSLACLLLAVYALSKLPPRRRIIGYLFAVFGGLGLPLMGLNLATILLVGSTFNRLRAEPQSVREFRAPTSSSARSDRARPLLDPELPVSARVRAPDTSLSPRLARARPLESLRRVIVQHDYEVAIVTIIFVVLSAIGMSLVSVAWLSGFLRAKLTAQTYRVATR